MKYSAKIKQLMFQWGMTSLMRRISPRKHVAILRYHAVVDPETCYYASPYICIHPDDFDRQIRFLSQHYTIISLDTVAQCIQRGQPFPPNGVVLTFDDGYRDNYLAYQIMKTYNVPGTFYVAAGCLGNGEPLWLFEVIYLVANTVKKKFRLTVHGNPISFECETPGQRSQVARKITEIVKANDLATREEIRSQLRACLDDVTDLDEKASRIMLTWDQVREMSDWGMTFGGHTMTHLNLPNAGYGDAFREIEQCRLLIQDRTGKPVRHFSYPNSGKYAYYNDTIKEMVRQCGYLTSTTSNNGLVDHSSDLLALKRIRITSNLAEVVYQMECEPVIDMILGIN